MTCRSIKLTTAITGKLSCGTRVVCKCLRADLIKREKPARCCRSPSALLSKGIAMETMSVSPEKSFEVRTEVWEARNSLWVYSPSIWDATLSSCIFSFKDENWSLDNSVWKDDATVSLCLRKFPGNHRPDSLMVEIDCLALQAKVLVPAAVVAIEDLESAL